MHWLGDDVSHTLSMTLSELTKIAVYTRSWAHASQQNYRINLLKFVGYTHNSHVKLVGGIFKWFDTNAYWDPFNDSAAPKPVYPGDLNEALLTV